MSKVELKVKIAEGFEKTAKIPAYATKGAACFDLVAATEELVLDATGSKVVYDTGLAFEIPEGYVGFVFPRSSVSTKTTLLLGNGVGVIDSDYRGTVKFVYRNINLAAGKKYEKGDRIGQMMIMPIPAVELVKTETVTETERGEGGYGSTGK